MRMPGIAREPLSPDLEALRAAVMALPLAERRQLMRRLHGDISRENDQRHNEAADRADREMKRRRPDPRQMSLEDAA